MESTELCQCNGCHYEVEACFCGEIRCTCECALCVTTRARYVGRKAVGAEAGPGACTRGDGDAPTACPYCEGCDTEGCEGWPACVPALVSLQEFHPVPAAFDLTWWAQNTGHLRNLYPIQIGSSHRFAVVVYPYDSADGDRWAWRLFQRCGKAWAHLGANAGLVSKTAAKNQIGSAMRAAGLRVMGAT